MNIFSLFKPSEKEQAIEAELAGTTKPTRAHIQPPKRGGTSSTLPGAGADSELMQLRSSLATVESRLQAVTSERDSLKAQFDSYRSASQADQRELEQKNQRLQTSLNEVSQALSQQIASSGLSAPVPEATDTEPEAKGLARAIKAHKSEANPQKPLTRPTL